MQRIYLARYGLPQEKLIEFKGPFDMKLSEIAEVSAEELGKWLKEEIGGEPIHIFCSPFRRALHTAVIVARILDVPVNIERGLTEWQTPSLIGEQEPYSPPDIMTLHREFKEIDTGYESIVKKYNGFESEKEMIARVGEVARKIADSHFPANVLMVSHAPCLLGIGLSLEDLGESVKSSKMASGWPLGGVTQFSRGKKGGDYNLDTVFHTAHLSGCWKEGKQAWTLPCLQ